MRNRGQRSMKAGEKGTTTGGEFTGDFFFFKPEWIERVNKG